MAVVGVPEPHTGHGNGEVTSQGAQPAHTSQGLNQACTYPPPTADPPSHAAPDPTDSLTAGLTKAFTVALTRVTPAATASTQRRDQVKGGRYDGNMGWETYWAQFQVTAKSKQWDTIESPDQLATALDGEARRVLLDLSPMDMTDPQTIAQAIERPFGDPTSSVAVRWQINE